MTNPRRGIHRPKFDNRERLDLHIFWLLVLAYMKLDERARMEKAAERAAAREIEERAMTYDDWLNEV